MKDHSKGSKPFRDLFLHPSTVLGIPLHRTEASTGAIPPAHWEDELGARCCCCCPYFRRTPAPPYRLPFEVWRAMGCVPSGVSPQDLGIAFTRAHRGKRQPRLWSQRGARKPCYSAEELLRSLVALTIWGEGE